MLAIALSQTLLRRRQRPRGRARDRGSARASSQRVVSAVARVVEALAASEGDLAARVAAIERALDEQFGTAPPAGFRLFIGHAPPSSADHRLLAVPCKSGRGWLAVPSSAEDVHVAPLMAALGPLLDLCHEQERTRQVLGEAERQKQEGLLQTALLQAASHELRSPLAAIRACTEALAAESRDTASAAQRELLAALAAESERLERTVDDLLDLARNEAGRLPVRSRPCAIERIVADVVGEIAASDAPRVRVETVPPLPLCRCDPGHIKHALRNLIDNALRVSPAHEQVTVRVTSGPAGVVVSVSDRGPGVPKQLRRAIFEPFVQGPRGGNSGLGLAVAKALVEANGGRLWLASTSQPSVTTQAQTVGRRAGRSGAAGARRTVPPGGHDAARDARDPARQGATFRLLVPITEGEGSAHVREAPPAHYVAGAHGRRAR